MATLTFSTVAITAYVNAADRLSVSPSSSSFTLPLPTPTIYVAGFTGGGATSRSVTYFKLTLPTGTTYYLSSGATAYTADGTWSGPVSFSGGPSSLSTSTFFSSSNPTVRTRTASITAINEGFATRTSLTARDASSNASYGYCDSGVLTYIDITLNAPPTFTTTQVSFDTNYVYTGLTTASVTVSSASAKYGGSVSSVALTIGSQTVTRSGNGTLSILLNAAGTFTPTVTVTDSRGQTTTKTLDPITVNTYTAPSVSFDVARTLNDGTPDDEGTYGLIEAELTFTDVIAEALAPSVVLTDDSGTQTTPTTTWYTSSSLATQVTWASVSSGDTVYGLFSGLSTQHSYQVSVRPRDSEGTGTAVTQTIAPAFYTIDFYAGGHGIAFGRPANSDGFYSAMTAEFEDTATFGADVLIDLPEYQTASTTDKAIYDAIVALGWDSDVLIP